MEADFKIVVITPEDILADEAARIVALLESGAVWRVHIRHPHASAKEISAILSAIPQGLYRHISLHDCYELSAKYCGVGIHLNARNGNCQPKGVVLSKSCHSIAEVQQSDCDYVTLSPIFDSISKNGYKSAFKLNDDLKLAIQSRCVIALGGVTPDSFDALESAGFAGAALLGYVWQRDITEFNNRINAIYAAIHN